jgi:hypothetical protein
MFSFGIFMRSNLANPLSVGENPASAFGPRINVSFTTDELDEFNTDVPNHNPGKDSMIIFHEPSIKSPAQNSKGDYPYSVTERKRHVARHPFRLERLASPEPRHASMSSQEHQSTICCSSVWVN